DRRLVATPREPRASPRCCQMTEPPPSIAIAVPPVAPLSPAPAVLHVVLVVCGIALALWALYRLESVVLVLTLAALFAYVIAPLVPIAERAVSLARPRGATAPGG